MKFPNEQNVSRRDLAVQSATGVFEACNWFAVIGIYAASHTAKMIEEKAIRNKAKALLVIKAMGLEVSSSDADLAVAICVDRQLPNPARCLVATVFNQVAHVLAHVVIVNKPHRVIFEDAEREVALLGYRRILTAAAKAKARWVRCRNFYAGWQIHSPLQVDGSGNPGGTRRLTSVSKADAQPSFDDVGSRLAYA